MLLYIDEEFKLHQTNEAGFIPVDISFFDGKSKSFIEGYRYIPAGESWTREDGQAFTGEMIVPWRPYEVLEELQALYEEEQAKSAEEIAALVEEVYNSDMEVIENV